MKKLVLLGLLVLAVIAGMGPYVSGQQAEQQYLQMAAYANQQQGVLMQTVRYERGYLASEIETRLVLPPVDPDSPESVELRFVTTLEHGVLSVTAITRPVFEKSTLEDMQKLFNDEQPVELVTKVGMTGNVVGKGLIKPIDYTDEENGATVVSAPVHFSMAIPASHEHMTFQLTWDGLQVTDENGEYLKMSGLSLAQTGTPLSDYLWTGDVDFRLDSIEGNEGVGDSFSLQGLTMQSRTDLVAENTIDSSVTMSVAVIEYQGEKLEGHRFEFALESLAVDKFDGVMMALESMEEANMVMDEQQRAQQQMAAFGEVGEKLNALLESGFRVRIKELHVQTVAGPIDGSMELTQAKLVPGEPRPASLLSLASGEASFSAPAALLENDDPEWQEKLSLLQAQSLLVKQGDTYVSNIKLANMMLDLNGVDMPLPPLM